MSGDTEKTRFQLYVESLIASGNLEGLYDFFNTNVYTKERHEANKLSDTATEAINRAEFGLSTIPYYPPTLANYLMRAVLKQRQQDPSSRPYYPMNFPKIDSVTEESSAALRSSKEGPVRINTILYAIFSIPSVQLWIEKEKIKRRDLWKMMKEFCDDVSHWTNESYDETLNKLANLQPNTPEENFTYSSYEMYLNLIDAKVRFSQEFEKLRNYANEKGMYLEDSSIIFRRPDNSIGVAIALNSQVVNSRSVEWFRKMRDLNVFIASNSLRGVSTTISFHGEGFPVLPPFNIWINRYRETIHSSIDAVLYEKSDTGDKYDFFIRYNNMAFLCMEKNLFPEYTRPNPVLIFGGETRDLETGEVFDNGNPPASIIFDPVLLETGSSERVMALVMWTKLAQKRNEGNWSLVDIARSITNHFGNPDKNGMSKGPSNLRAMSIDALADELSSKALKAHLKKSQGK